MKFINRPKKTTAELIALISQRHVDGWPVEFALTIDRSAEHDWIAMIDPRTLTTCEARTSEFNRSLGQIVSDLRSRHAWAGY